MIEHDLWTEERVAQWDAMTPEDRGREFDARVARGWPLVEREGGGLGRLATPAELRKAFVADGAAFDVFQYSARHPVFPLLIGPGGAASRPTPPAPAAAPVAVRPATVPAPSAPQPAVAVPSSSPAPDAAKAMWARQVAKINARREAERPKSQR